MHTAKTYSLVCIQYPPLLHPSQITCSSREEEDDKKPKNILQHLPH